MRAMDSTNNVCKCVLLVEIYSLISLQEKDLISILVQTNFLCKSMILNNITSLYFDRKIAIKIEI